MTELRVRRREGRSLEPVDEGNPLPVAIIPSRSAGGGFQSITVSTTAIALAPPSGTGAKAALITVESAAIRIRTDGASPTATVGHEAFAGDIVNLESAFEINQFKAISRDGGSATVRVSYVQ